MPNTHFQRRHGAKEARELLRAHGGATAIDDSTSEQNWDALFGALAKAGCDMTERVTRNAVAEVNDDEESRPDNITAQLNDLATKTHTKRKADAAPKGKVISRKRTVSLAR
jgi:hypothetical protein